MLFRRFDELAEGSDVMVVGRLTEDSVTPGRVESGEADGASDRSTVFIRLQVENVLIDHPEYPVGDSVVIEIGLPDGSTVEDFAAAAPIGRLMLFSGPEPYNAKGMEDELPDPGERLYNPFLQSLVVEDEAGRYRSVAPSDRGLLAFPESTSIPVRFADLVALIETTLG